MGKDDQDKEQSIAPFMSPVFWEDTWRARRNIPIRGRLVVIYCKSKTFRMHTEKRSVCLLLLLLICYYGLDSPRPSLASTRVFTSPLHFLSTSSASSTLWAFLYAAESSSISALDEKTQSDTNSCNILGGCVPTACFKRSDSRPWFAVLIAHPIDSQTFNVNIIDLWRDSKS